jgi:uncharacterized protein (TIGR02246 family)
MRYLLSSIGLLVVLLFLISPVVSQDKQPETQQTQEKADKPAADHSADEAAIRANIAAFVKAYNAHDAKAIAALFTADGKIVAEDGDESEGREAIAQTFAGLFSNSPKKQIEVNVETLRFIGSDLAIEEGSTKETEAPGEPPEYDRYTVVHVKRDGKWQMAMARDEQGPSPTIQEQLRPLAWLVGDWVDDGGSSVVRSSCRWSKDGNFLMQEFDLQLAGENAMHVSQRIGWDPAAKHIRSWVFDSEGGFGESVWTRDGNAWLIKATGVRPDGDIASATDILVPVGKDAYVWRSRDRIDGNDIEAPVVAKVIRKPPQPQQ